MSKIFYVEDEPNLGKIVKDTLVSCGYAVDLFEDGLKAIEGFDESHDICVLDIMVPSRSGYEIAMDIRQKSMQVPILFLTAKDQTEDVLKGFESGGNDYIRKPFSIQELIVRINNLLALTGAHSNVKDGVVKIGKYKFDTGRLQLSFGDFIQKLSHRDVQILRMLLDHMNDTTSRKEILLEVWGDDSIFNSRNLDVYIAKLRKYFKKDPSIQIITLKGVGYRFVMP